ncbi:protoglobin domain-containing protein [Thiothrix nivea]|uniref:Globin domain-containing protein n=1 Tax=Thiothrix nivea (strain ATCC 35100 / DSM 5205 / JP2) TaxID=870187 RepID=A0A656HG21_THINJ|nr:protoglobin domain-containing protein [Thiothrix nivea]EIJ34954.1 Globin domain-containing protein [Thiothrix nivea DSM 5205]
MDLTSMTNHILQQVPAILIPTASDGELVRRYQGFFKKHEDTVIRGFYDLVYSDPATRQHLDPKERPMRENTLRQWYQVTTTGHFDEHYWAWQALVGIVHVKHKIPNPAMLGMWSWMINFIQKGLLEELPANEALDVIQVFQKLQATVCSLIVESYIMTQQEAIHRASGLNQAIMGRFIHIEIDRLLGQGRAILQEKVQQAAMAA